MFSFSFKHRPWSVSHILTEALPQLPAFIGDDVISICRPSSCCKELSCQKYKCGYGMHDAPHPAKWYVVLSSLCGACRLLRCCCVRRISTSLSEYIYYVLTIFIVFVIRYDIVCLLPTATPFGPSSIPLPLIFWINCKLYSFSLYVWVNECVCVVSCGCVFCLCVEGDSDDIDWQSHRQWEPSSRCISPADTLLL